MVAEQNARAERIVLVEMIAEACHEANRVICIYYGDDSQFPWAEAPDWQKFSARSGVELHLDEPDTSPEQSHEAWREEKEKYGWVYGREKDVAMKRHPCMVPYDQLDEHQKLKDKMFKALVTAMA